MEVKEEDVLVVEVAGFSVRRTPAAAAAIIITRITTVDVSIYLLPSYSEVGAFVFETAMSSI